MPEGQSHARRPCSCAMAPRRAALLLLVALAALCAAFLGTAALAEGEQGGLRAAGEADEAEEAEALAAGAGDAEEGADEANGGLIKVLRYGKRGGSGAQRRAGTPPLRLAAL